MNEDRLAEAIEHAISGSAICFLGAGFSTLAGDSGGTRKVPSSSELTDELWKLANVPPEPGSSLTDIAEFFEANSRGAELAAYLGKRLTFCKPAPVQETILNLPWRAIFTTNFDDIVERALPEDKIQVVSPIRRPNFILTDKIPLYYLHGRALDLSERSGVASLVLSESNYLDVRSKDSDLYAAFVNEIHAASQIFFIGYSVRDTEIASRIVTLGDSLRRKSVVIAKPGQGAVANARLQKFGDIAGIGVEGLAAALEAQAHEPVIRDSGLVFLKAVERPEPVTEVTKGDVDSLILTGEFNRDCFSAQRRKIDPSDVYCVDHTSKIGEILSPKTRGVNRFLITSDIGNGKSTFLGQLTVCAIEDGFSAYIIDSTLIEIYRDVDTILSRKEKCIFIVDDLIRYRNISKYIGERLHDSAILVCTTRDSFGSLKFGRATELLSGAVREVALDRLSADELNSWDQFLERWGYWEQRIEMSPTERVKFLSEDCGAENRSIVVSVFQSSSISKKIANIVDFFLRNNEEHLTPFVAILVASLCQKHVRWDQIVAWLNIDEDGFRSALAKDDIFDFLSPNRNWHLFTSAQLADHIFRRFDLNKDVIVDVYSRIVRETAYSSNDSRSGGDSRENLKELMKFRFLTRLFGEGSDAAKTIEAVYSRLSKVKKIRLNDQFWLQYAMSCMERKDIPDAETYLNTALGLAEKKGMDYDDDQIIDQRIRLLLMKNAQPSYKIKEAEISIALEDLTSSLANPLQTKIYPIRSATYILELLDSKIDEIGRNTMSEIGIVLDTMKSILDDNKQLPKSQRGETSKLREQVRRARLVVQNS
ncbi:SIR2 family protein [Devosia soli]|uniref:SIR2 family protein n=1 Tax=Devosia soli TaxID=361041 RepID=UPI000A6CB762|nr:SIR2 family protein [Devosia soli]